MQRVKLGLEKFFNVKFDLLKIKVVKRIVWSRIFQFALILPNFLFLELIIMAGIIGSPFANENFATVFVWYIWWPILVILLLPFASRIWCAMCPIPAVGEWLQRKAVIEKREEAFSLNRKWPKKLEAPWIGLFIFLLVSVFHMIFISSPLVTGSLMLGLTITALIFHLVFEKRAYCRYVCPIGCFLSLYSMVASLELRVKDRDACVELGQSKPLPCVEGTKVGYGCPWFENPAEMERNNYCGLCMECVKTCPVNISLNVRSFGKDLLVEKGRNFTEAWSSFLLFSLGVVAYALEKGPLVWMKPWAFMREGAWNFILYSVIHVGLVLLPAQVIFLMFLLLSKLITRDGNVSLKKMFTYYAYSLVPLGLVAWISFTLPIFLIGIPRAISTISDPYGWGWNLFGTKKLLLYLPYNSFMPYLQVAISIIASIFSLFIVHRISLQLFQDKKRALRGFIPIATFIISTTALLVWLYISWP